MDFDAQLYADDDNELLYHRIVAKQKFGIGRIPFARRRTISYFYHLSEHSFNKYIDTNFEIIPKLNFYSCQMQICQLPVLEIHL